MTVIFVHDLNTAGYQDLNALLEEAAERFGPGIADHIRPREEPSASSQDIAAELDAATPPEDLELLSRLVALSEV